jgi:hypothetical protein
MGNPPMTIQRFDKLEELISRVLTPGVFSFFPFRPEELPTGWYHANGDQFDVTSDEGVVLLALSDNYKADWDIGVQDDLINLPNYYASDGRGYFLRAGPLPGEEQGDTIRNIKGGLPMYYAESASNQRYTGPFKKTVAVTANYSFSTVATSGFNLLWFDDNGFDADRQVPTDVENKPLNKSAIPAVYLGVIH